jgi:hypothetical protein
MIEAFKTGFAMAAGVITAGLIFLGILGAFDWASEWLGYLVNVIRLDRHKGKGGTI